MPYMCTVQSVSVPGDDAQARLARSIPDQGENTKEGQNSGNPGQAAITLGEKGASCMQTISSAGGEDGVSCQNSDLAPG